MGSIVAKFWVDETIEQRLAKINKAIKSILDFQKTSVKRRIIIYWCFIIFSILVYATLFVKFCVNFNSLETMDTILYICVFILVPVLVFLERLYNWFYNNKISKNQAKLACLKNEKTKLLKTVMERETYNNAQIILQMYAPEEINNEQYFHEHTLNENLI